MSHSPVALPRLPYSCQSRARTRWNFTRTRLNGLDALRFERYYPIRDLIPGFVLTAWLFVNRPGSTPFLRFWRTGQLTVFHLTVLFGLTCLWRVVAGGKWTDGVPWIRSQITGNLAAALCCSAVLFGVGDAQHFPGGSLRLSLYFFFTASLLSFLLAAAASLLNSARMTYAQRDVILLGSGPRAQALFAELTESPAYRIAGVVDDDFIGPPEMHGMYLGGVDDLERILKEAPVGALYCALPIRSMYNQAQRAVSICRRVGVEVRYSTELFDTCSAQQHPHVSAHVRFAILRTVREDSTGTVKRVIDIFGALLLLIASAPILAVAALAVKLTSPGPVLFSQERCGLNRKHFRIFKVRTMVVNAEHLQQKYESLNELDGPVFKIRLDPRVTPVGRFLRKSSIDELPQLWNVLMGDMSLVGPRPLALRDFLRIDDGGHLRRFSMKPGLTCLWQISGRNNTGFEQWIRKDLEYIDCWSLLLDASILLRTLPAVLCGRGAM
jgi:exopolysaccharide biosynthesis polyprenyl glycosylphosphotransferase